MSLFGLHELIEAKYDATNALLEEILVVLKRIDSKMPEPKSATTPPEVLGRSPAKKTTRQSPITRAFKRPIAK